MAGKMKSIRGSAPEPVRHRLNLSTAGEVLDDEGRVGRIWAAGER